jgi:Molybdopterin-binding domain of aldehyde dehydrogenase
VEIDPETGVVQILRHGVVDDVGTVINPKILKGFTVGSFRVWDRRSWNRSSTSTHWAN